MLARAADAPFLQQFCASQPLVYASFLGPETAVRYNVRGAGYAVSKERLAAFVAGNFRGSRPPATLDRSGIVYKRVRLCNTHRNKMHAGSPNTTIQFSKRNGPIWD